MPEKLFQERGDFEKNRYKLTGNEIAQMEKNQQTYYNELIRLMKHGEANLALEGKQELTNMKIRHFYEEVNDNNALNEFVAGSNAAVALLTTGAELYKERQEDFLTAEILNPENHIKAQRAVASAQAIMRQSNSNIKTADQMIGILNRDPQTRFFAELLKNKNSGITHKPVSYTHLTLPTTPYE